MGISQEALRDLPDPALLPAVEQALGRAGPLHGLPLALRPLYAAEQDHAYRHGNRVAICIFTLIFDYFAVAQFKSAPELVALSLTLRLGLHSPAALLFLVLDRREMLPRHLYTPFLLALAAAPAISTALLCLQTVSASTMSDIRATPLILLSAGLFVRMPPLAVIANALISVTAFTTSVVLSPVVPRAELGSLLVTSISIGATVIGFSVMLDQRDRRVFLLNLLERVRAAGLAAQNQGLKRETQTDALTGAANRRCFDETLARAWADGLAGCQPVSLIMIDVDHFKAFNDCYGHQGGDDCLMRVAARIRGEARAGDLCARYGGEEFAVILPETTPAMASSIAERIRLAVVSMAMPHAGMGAGATVSISLGVASTIPAEPAGAAKLIELADRNLYAAKSAGRNRVFVGDRAGAVAQGDEGEKEGLLF